MPDSRHCVNETKITCYISEERGKVSANSTEAQAIGVNKRYPKVFCFHKVRAWKSMTKAQYNQCVALSADSLRKVHAEIRSIHCLSMKYSLRWSVVVTHNNGEKKIR